MINNKKIIAIIPARKGSKRIKNKNLLKITGIPLISFSINYAKKSKLIDRIFVSTDGEDISRVSKKYGAEIILRPAKLASDSSSSDSAVLHAINYVKNNLKYDFDIVVFLQPTTVLRQLGELDLAIKSLVKKKLDTVFSSVDYHPFLWRKKGKNFSPDNFDPVKRKMSQNITTVNETGSYYITKKETFINFKNRFGGKISNFKSDYHSILEIDKIEDYLYITNLIKTNIPRKYKLCIPLKK